METLCCSNKCEKRLECARADINNEGMHCVEDFYSFGTGTITENGCEVDHWCGELDNYKMFKPIEEIEPEAKIPFPFQYLEQYFRGELIWDAAIDNTIYEMYRLIEEYVEKHCLKT